MLALVLNIWAGIYMVKNANTNDAQIDGKIRSIHSTARRGYPHTLAIEVSHSSGMELDCMNKRTVKWSDSKLDRQLPTRLYQQNQIDANGSHRPIYKYEIRFPVIARIPHQTKDSLVRRSFLP